MHGRRLSTTEELLVIAGSDGGDALETVERWAADRELTCRVVADGEGVRDVYDPERAALGMTLGGDGAFLEGTRAFGPRGVPLLGVNTGAPAFRSRVAPEDVPEALTEVVRGRATVDSRPQLAVSAPGFAEAGVNEVAVADAASSDPADRSVTRLHAFLDDEYVGAYEGAGLVVSTPTGATGLALSAGGAVQYPRENHTVQVVPVHPRRLGTRPLVVGASSTLEVIAEGPVDLVVDGGCERRALEAESVVSVAGADRPAHVVRTSYDDHFFTALASERGWGLRDRDDAGPREFVAPAERSAGGFLDRALRVAVGAAESAGESLRELHGRVEAVEHKSSKADIVTRADYQSDDIIATVIENEFPDHTIRSEESPTREGSSEYAWLVDPLDGTGNFAHGNPNYSVSIALLERTDPVVGVVYVPETDETFTAIAGRGAWEDGTPLSTTDRSRLEESMLLSGYDPEGTFLSHFYAETRGVRRLGSAALNLCYLASGSADAVWEYDTYPWDVAAGLLIARTAGATVTDSRGDPYALRLDREEERAELLGSNGPLHATLLEHLRERGNDLQQPE